MLAPQTTGAHPTGPGPPQSTQSRQVLSSIRRAAYPVVFVAATVFALVWLFLGALPALGAVSDGFHDWLHDLADVGGPIGDITRNAAQASHTVTDGSQVALDYLFSAFNLGLALTLMWLRPKDVTARLLAVALIGTSIAFNLQGHDALQVFPASVIGPIGTAHVWVHIVSGICYVFALLLFPNGRFVEARPIHEKARPFVIALVSLFFVALSSITVDDHITGLVILFGIFVPIAGIVSQLGRYRKAKKAEEREQSRVLLWALALAIGVAAPLMYLTGSLGGGGSSETVDYEVELAAGNYYFRCDPHPEDMRGVVIANEAGPLNTTLSAEESRFDRETLALAANEPVSLRFTNRDGDLHNVAIYRDQAMTDPIFVGKEFSGSTTGVAAFRIFRMVMLVVPVALLVGLVRFRLWDVNRFLRRTIAYALVIGFVTVAYLAIVVGLGSMLGLGRINPTLSIVVTVIVAALFQPLRDRARKLATLLVYGKRATPYDLLSEFTERVGSAPDLERLVPELARTLGNGTGAEAAEVWLRVGDRLVCAAAWPDEARAPSPMSLTNGHIPELDRDRVVPVRHAGELLGALAITKRFGEEVTPVEDRLLADAASQTGLALRNVQLTAELHERLDELRASRQRLVVASDAERRRLERDIHDGAQQHLVALSMKLRLAQDLSQKDPARADALLAELQDDTSEALQALRDLARGIHPPVLSDRGLGPALEAHARRTPIPVSLKTENVGRYDPNVETAVYFCCTEAIQNAAKHSGAGSVEIDLVATDEELTFTVSDDGSGFELASSSVGGLANMHDRMEALAGVLTVHSTVDHGTTITGRIPLRPHS